MIVITTIDALPNHCYECPCHDGESGYCQADKERRYSDYRPYWCPLKEIGIDLINKIIEEAIYHGGDPGGPYFCNEKRLEGAVRELSEALECGYEWDEEKDPQFIRLKQS